MKSLRFVVPILIGGLVFGSLPLVNAQGAGLNTAALQAWSSSITNDGYMGAPRYTTVLLPTCGANNTGALAYDTTAGSLTVCSGSAWTAVGGAGGATTIAMNDDVLITFGTGTDAGIEYDTAQTPDSWMFGVGQDSRTLWLREQADSGDYALAQQTNPTLAIHSAAATANQYISIAHDQTNGVIDVGTGVVSFPDGITTGAGTTSLALTAASSLITISNVDSAMYFGGARGGRFGLRQEQTPDSFHISTGTTGNSLHIFEDADLTFDWNNGPCGTAACINPQFIVFDKDQNVTNYQSLGVSGLSGRFVVTLTETTATAAVQLPVAAETSIAGEFIYTVHATDGSTPQTRSGRVLFNVNNDGGTETCVLGTPEELDNTPTGTLTATITCVTSPTNAVNIAIDATSSLSQTTLEAYGTVIFVGAGEPLPQ